MVGVECGWETGGVIIDHDYRRQLMQVWWWGWRLGVRLCVVVGLEF
jgi:hypothetical protein